MKSMFKNQFRNIFSSQFVETDYIFDASIYPGKNLFDKITKTAATTVISGTRYGIVNGVVTAFGVNQPALEDDGFRGCPAFTQYFLNNEVPATQSITLVAGSYCLWVEGSGSVTFNGLIATAGVPKLFTLASSFTGNCVISGTVAKCMLNSGLFPAPFSPTHGVLKSFVSETGSATTGTSFDLDDVKLARLKTGLRGPNAQGHLEFTFKSNFDSNNLEWQQAISFLTCTDTNSLGFKYLYGYIPEFGGAHFFFLYPKDTGSGCDLILDVSIDEIFKISLDWGKHPTGQKMRLTVNGVQTALANFAGWGTGDLVFFYENTIHAGWIKKDSFKIYDRPRW